MGVAVIVGVSVGACVEVAVGVCVGVFVGVGLGVFVGNGVSVGVSVGAGVGVDVGISYVTVNVGAVEAPEDTAYAQILEKPLSVGAVFSTS